MGVGTRNLLPSVRCGVEQALLAAIAAFRQMPLAHLLTFGFAGVKYWLDCQGQFLSGTVHILSDCLVLSVKHVQMVQALTGIAPRMWR